MKPDVVVRRAQVTLDWADGRYLFRLPVEQLEELQELCDAGPAWIHARLGAGQWRRKDISETIRLGLIGGGMKPTDARKLIARYVDARPLEENTLVAQVILSAVLVGVPDEAIKKAAGEESEQRSSPSQTESSDSPTSTESAAPWVSTSVN